MLSRILTCDHCGASTAAGARPAETGQSARSKTNSGTIRRVYFGAMLAQGNGNLLYLVIEDRCADCCTPAELERNAAHLARRSAKVGGRWVPAAPPTVLYPGNIKVPELPVQR